MRANYWSCSKFADWLRGTPKPSAETSKGWRVWKKAAKETHPIRYWIVEEGLDYLQNFVNWPGDRLSDIRYYINNRWITRTHCLTAHPRDIKPGQWQDVGNRFLPCLFNELVDFVEVETAWHHVLWDEKARKKYGTPWARSFLRFRTWRCPEAGMSHLVWASELKNDEWCPPGHPDHGKPTPQALAAKEIIDLYVWWTAIRPQRPDPHDASGWSDLCDRRRQTSEDSIMWEDATQEEQDETKKALDKCQELELQYEQEDEEMMIRLIKVRQSLWT
jgi:hypothetical protein